MKIEDWTNKIHNGHVIDILREMPSRSIDVCVTSPPYWGLRDYGETTKVKWDNWEGQLGLEPHPQMYIDHLVTIFREVKRALKDSGSFWLNLGDTYCGAKGGFYNKRKDADNFGFTNKEHQMKRKAPSFNGKWLQPKQKMLIPERVAIALQEDGWILRNDIIWYKPNHMPSSVKDRLTSSYEHVFFFVKSRKYYFDLDSIRVPHTSIRWGKNTKYESKHSGLEKQGYSELGKNPGDMWTINTKPFKGAHFAVFPTTLIEKIIKCAGPKEVCTKCGFIRERIVERKGLPRNRSKGKQVNIGQQDGRSDISGAKFRKWKLEHPDIFIGWSKCDCGAEFKKGIVLDPFIGSGTTGVVAKQLGLNFIGIELNSEYCKIATKRIGNVEVKEYKVNRSKIKKKEIVVENIAKSIIGPTCGYKGNCSYRTDKGECAFKKYCRDKIK